MILIQIKYKLIIKKNKFFNFKYLKIIIQIIKIIINVLIKKIIKKKTTKIKIFKSI